MRTRSRAATQLIFERMSESAMKLGAELISAERRLDLEFRGHRITPESLTRVLAEIGGLVSRLRNVHLSAHLEQTQLLTPEQVARYQALRGYASGAADLAHRHDGGM